MNTVNRSNFLPFFGALVGVAVLYLGRDLFIPFALAALLTFLLNPLVRALLRWGIPRVLGVVLATVLCFSALSMIAWLLGGELTHLAEDLPNYRQNIVRRIESLQHLGKSEVLQRLRDLIGEVQGTAKAGAPPVVSITPIVQSPPAENQMGLIRILNAVVPTLATFLGIAGVVILFVFFMLLRLDDISQRCIRLVGYSRVTLTTRVLDEAAERVSRYLLMQVTVNTIYGVLLASGLALLGMPYVVLWGALATVLRFIPYVGPWVVAVLAATLSLAVFDGWTQPLMVAGVIVVLELLTNMILEPLLYGHSAGVSDFALLVAIAFWTWLWGGVGLVLATPLTVCIVVFCKYIPSLEWVEVLMGENPRVQPHLNYYQHHLANDESASQALIDAGVKKEGIEKTIETLVLPAVALTRFEEVAGKLSAEEASQMYGSMRSAFTMLSESAESNDDARKQAEAGKPDSAEPENPDTAAAGVTVLGRALQGEADALALEILAGVLPKHLDFEISAEPLLTGELVQLLEKVKPDVLCLSALPPRSQFSAAILCRRLRGKLPHLKILVCRWIVPGQEPPAPEPLLAAGATWVASTMQEAREILEGVENVNEVTNGKPASPHGLP